MMNLTAFGGWLMFISCRTWNNSAEALLCQTGLADTLLCVSSTLSIKAPSQEGTDIQ